MNGILWAGQIYLALNCLFSGFSKSIFSERKLVLEMKQTGVEGLPQPLIRFIGISQLLGAAGLIMPWLLNILPVLTPVAAFAFGIDVTMASGIHIQRREYKTAAITLFTAMVSFFVSAGRFYFLY
jgi:DoxX-like protein